MKKLRNPIAKYLNFNKAKILPDKKQEKKEAIEKEEYITFVKSKEPIYEFFQ